MREAIYESHGIMTSADKNIHKGQSAVMNTGVGAMSKQRRLYRFGSQGTRHHSLNEKSQLAVTTDSDSVPPQPLTARVTPSSVQQQRLETTVNSIAQAHQINKKSRMAAMKSVKTGTVPTSTT